MTGRLRNLMVPALLAGTILLGSAGRPEAAAAPAPGAFTVYVPCVISAPVQKILLAYTETHPRARIDTATDKPLAVLGTARGEKAAPGVVLTLGQIEMDSLVAAGAVDRTQVVSVARNAYRMAVIVSAKNEALRQLADLAGPKAKRVAIEDPRLSSLGDRAVLALKQRKLWKRISAKVVHFDPEQNVLSELLAGKADATFVYQDCLFAEGGSPPRTIRVLATLPVPTEAPIVYQAAPLKRAGESRDAAEFLTWLSGPAGRKALQKAGLSPP